MTEHPEHRCAAPEVPAGMTRTWRCPECLTRYVWTERMIGRQMAKGWQRMHDDMETRRLRNERDYRRAVTITVIIAVIALLLVAGGIVWLVESLT